MMQTRKLIAGETFLLDDEKGFCLVVEGEVQIYTKFAQESHQSSPDTSDDEDEGRRHGYQLLTEVKNGAPMSSLFSILSLFTEDIKLRAADDDGSAEPPKLSRGPSEGLHSAPLMPEPNSVPPTLANLRERSSSSAASFYKERSASNVPPLSLEGSQRRKQSVQASGAQSPTAHPDILARAKVDTTIAIIPATAFRRLTRNHPRSTAHIVQGTASS